MRFLRMLTNSVIAGALGAAYLTIVVLQLNPQVPLVSATTSWLFAIVLLFYGVHLTVICYLLMLAREIVGLNALSPGWVSVRVLAWLAAALAAGASALMWFNVQGYPEALDATAIRRMTAGAAATTATTVVLLGLAIAHFSFGRRGSRVGAALLTIAVFGSLALPIAARGRGAAAGPPLDPAPLLSHAPASDGPRVMMILLDGASLDQIWPSVAGGRLPNFARLLDSGASMDLATVRPTAPDPVWAAVATGMHPAKNGVRGSASFFVRGGAHALALLPDHCFSHALVHLGLVRQEPYTAEALRGRPLWSILADAGMDVGVVRWPLTYPVQPVRGFVLSDRFHDLLGSFFELDDRGAFPADTLPVARAAFAQRPALPDELFAGLPGNPDGPERGAAVRDDLYRQAMQALRARWPVRFSALRYQGLDTVGHYNLRFTQPREFGRREEERRRGVQLVDRYYAYIDTEIGEALSALRPDDLLLVVSGFGIEQPNAVKHLIGRLLGDPIDGTHERAPDGFLLAYGSAVQRGRRQRGSIVDVTPTVLYYLGLPVGRDMDGYARADLFRAEFAARPIAFIPTHNR